MSSEMEETKYSLFTTTNQADSYAKGRPTYPAWLFQKLAAGTKYHERAWDVGTGQGQAAVALSEFYKSVIATDRSEAQLALAKARPNVTYSKLSATPSLKELESVVGAEGSVDLVTVATAIHWFDLDKFYTAVKHVLRKPGGVLAAWGYWMPQVSPEVDAVLDQALDLSKPYMPKQLQIVLNRYRTMPFPFEPVTVTTTNREEDGEEASKEAQAAAEGAFAHRPANDECKVETFDLKMQMSVDSYLEFLKSSTVVQAAIDHGAEDVLTPEFKRALWDAWGPADEIRTASWEAFLLMGSVSPQ